MTDATTTGHPILLVSNELDFRERCRRVLMRLGHQVDTAASGREGLAKVKQGDWSSVLLEVKLPDMNGIEVLQKIRVGKPDTMCIVMAADATVDLAVQTIKLVCTRQRRRGRE
jgi:DNA-binding NtrC family response regulator